MNSALLDQLIYIQPDPDFPYIFDIELHNVGALKAFDSVEVHLVLYPFSRQVVSDSYKFYPFEEYGTDISTHRRSLHARLPRPATSLFGIFVVLVNLAS